MGVLSPSFQLFPAGVAALLVLAGPMDERARFRFKGARVGGLRGGRHPTRMNCERCSVELYHQLVLRRRTASSTLRIVMLMFSRSSVV
jgi:hypothetical protein